MLKLRGLVVMSLACVALVLVAGSASLAEAGLLIKAEPKVKAKPVSALVLAKSATLADPSCCAPAPAPVVCCKQPCITYKHHCTLRRTCCDCCKPPLKIVLKVQDPCTCCTYDVPVCLPGCCCGEPVVCDKVGILGRASVTYEWCCGYRVKVVFDRCGDITVHSFGR